MSGKSEISVRWLSMVLFFMLLPCSASIFEKIEWKKKTKEYSAIAAIYFVFGAIVWRMAEQEPKKEIEQRKREYEGLKNAFERYIKSEEREKNPEIPDNAQIQYSPNTKEFIKIDLEWGTEKKRIFPIIKEEESE